MKNSTPKNSTPASANMAQLQVRAKELRLAGLLAHWDTLACDPARLAWVTELLGWEETERDQRSLERRLRASHIGKFKPLADYEWDWPRRCDRQAIQELMTLSFMADASNVMLVHKGKPTRVGYKVDANGKKQRIAKRSGEVI